MQASPGSRIIAPTGMLASAPMDGLSLCRSVQRSALPSVLRARLLNVSPALRMRIWRTGPGAGASGGSPGWPAAERGGGDDSTLIGGGGVVLPRVSTGTGAAAEDGGGVGGAAAEEEDPTGGNTLSV